MFRLLREEDLARPQRVIDDNHFLNEWGVTPDELVGFLNKGTMNRAGVWSPLSARPGMISLTLDDLRRQGQQGLLGFQMTSVVVEATVPGRKKRFKRYRLPTDIEREAARVETEELASVYADLPFGIPDEPTPAGGGSGASRAFSLHKYGMTKWRDMFTPRQLLALGTFVKHIRTAITRLKEENSPIAEPITAGLALGFDRLIDFANINVQWKLDAECINHSLVRYALQITWDFGEPNIIGEYSGAFGICCERVAEALDQLTFAGALPPRLSQRSACGAQAELFDACITDPPYYDAIPYSDLSDLFFVWLRRITSGLNPAFDEVMIGPLTPKWDESIADGELIDDESRFGGDRIRSKQTYEDGMVRAFKAAIAGLADSGRLVVVFANKEIDAWETLVSGLVRAGAVVTASWPIRTEQPSRMRGISSAALSSSVWIVCRKRGEAAAIGWEEQVVDRMKQILFEPRETLGGRNILQYYFDLGVRGPDFIWAALGPALEAYSSHPFVKKTAGGVMTVPEFLTQVRKLALQFSLGELPGFRDIAQETQGRGESLEIDAVTQYYLLHRAYFGLEPAPAGACILYANACGKNETELKVVWNILEQGGQSKRGRPRKVEEDEGAGEEASEESKGNEYRLLRWEERAARPDFGEGKSSQPTPLIDRLHRLMLLFRQNRVGEVQQLYEAWGLAGDRAFKPLLQAVRELALRDNQDLERRFVEALATQLKLNKRVVLEGGAVREMDLFSELPATKLTDHAAEYQP